MKRHGGVAQMNEQVMIPDQRDLEAAFVSAERDQEFQQFLGERGVSIVSHNELVSLDAAKKEFDAMKALDGLFESNPHLDLFVDAVDAKMNLALVDRPVIEVRRMVGALAESKEYNLFAKKYEKAAAEQKKLAIKAEKEAAQQAAEVVKPVDVPKLNRPVRPSAAPVKPSTKRATLPAIPRFEDAHEASEKPAAESIVEPSKVEVESQQLNDVTNKPQEGISLSDVLQDARKSSGTYLRSTADKIRNFSELKPQQKIRLVAGMTAVAAIVTPVASRAAQIGEDTTSETAISGAQILTLDKKAESPEEKKAIEVATTFSALADPDPEKAVQKQLEFVNEVIEGTKDKPNVLARKADPAEAKIWSEFLTEVVDGMAKQLKEEEPLTVQQNVDNVAKLTKHLVLHPDALRGAEAAGVARPQNEFQQKFTEYYTEVVDVEGVYSTDEINLIWGSFAKAYDVSSTPAEEAKILEVAAQAVAERKHEENEPREDIAPELQTGETTSNTETSMVEAAAADKAFSARVADLVNQASNGSWGNGRKIQPLDAGTLEKLLNETAARYNHPLFGRKVALAQLFQESKFDPSAGSHAGAQGIAQFMPGTWPSWSEGKDVHDPAAAIDAQFRFMIALCELMEKRFPDKAGTDILQLALAGYNAGPNNDAVEAGRIPQNGETNVYVDTITKIVIKTGNQMRDAAHEARIKNMVCPKGVNDLGIHQGSYEGRSRAVRLCAIPGLKSSSDESKPGHKYYINGAEGRVMVNVEIAEQVANMVKDAEKEGIDLRAVSSFRVWNHQQELWNANPNPAVVARPGTSSHQSGNAVDFEMNGMPITASFYKTMNGGAPSIDNPRVAPGSKTWEWLQANASKYGLKQYYNEPWHWSPTGH